MGMATPGSNLTPRPERMYWSARVPRDSGERQEWGGGGYRECCPLNRPRGCPSDRETRQVGDTGGKEASYLSDTPEANGLDTAILHMTTMAKHRQPACPLSFTRLSGFMLPLHSSFQIQIVPIVPGLVGFTCLTSGARRKDVENNPMYCFTIRALQLFPPSSARMEASCSPYFHGPSRSLSSPLPLFSVAPILVARFSLFLLFSVLFRLSQSQMAQRP